VKNGDEAGVDCGGVCLPCQQSEATSNQQTVNTQQSTPDQSTPSSQQSPPSEQALSAPEDRNVLLIVSLIINAFLVLGLITTLITIKHKKLTPLDPHQEQLRTYIQSKMATGMSQQQVKQELLAQRWAEESVNEVLQQL
jgi:hypothetical protein